MMMKRIRFRRPATMIAALLLALSLVLPGSTQAALQVTRVLAETNADWVQGRFGLTSLVESGGIQLLPLGALEFVRSNTARLCYPVGDMGVASHQTTATINNQTVTTTYFYLVGGRTPDDAGTTNPDTLSSVCYGRIQNTNGQITGWTVDNDQLPGPIRDNKAVAARTPNGQQAYIFSFGGSKGNANFSAAEIYRAQINADGSPGAWATLSLKMPRAQTDPVGSEGRHAFALTTYRATNGVTYIYVIGGLSRYVAGGTVVRYRRDVWRTQVQADGNLAAWTQMPSLAFTSDIRACAGLYNAQAVNFPVFDVDNNNNTVERQTLFLIGGTYQGDPSNACFQSERPSPSVYRATINADGSFAGNKWDSDPAQPPTNDDYNIFTIGQPLFGHQAVGFNQKIYVLGGQMEDTTGNTAPTRRVFASVAQSDQDLIEVPGGNNFYFNEDVLPQALYGHGAESGRFKDTPMFYIFGGRTGQGTIGRDFSNQFYHSIPSKDERTTRGFPKEAHYLSEIRDLEVTAKPLSLLWSAQIPSTDVDVKLNYRMAATEAAIHTQPWTAVDGDTASARWSNVGNPIDEVGTASTTVSGRFIQFRATLSSVSGGGTPVLKKVSVRFELDDWPNLQPDPNAGVTMPRLSSGPVVKIINAPPLGDTSTVLDADIENGGTFYVDLHLFAPGQPVVMPTLQGNSWSPQGQVFAQVNKANLPANSSYTIPSISWRDNRTCQVESQCPPVSDWADFFNVEGTWNVVVVVDATHNHVREADLMTQPWERDNVKTFQLRVTDSSGPEGVFLPVVTR